MIIYSIWIAKVSSLNIKTVAAILEAIDTSEGTYNDIDRGYGKLGLLELWTLQIMKH